MRTFNFPVPAHEHSHMSTRFVIIDLLFPTINLTYAGGNPSLCPSSFGRLQTKGSKGQQKDRLTLLPFDHHSTSTNGFVHNFRLAVLVVSAAVNNWMMLCPRYSDGWQFNARLSLLTGDYATSTFVHNFLPAQFLYRKVGGGRENI